MSAAVPPFKAFVIRQDEHRKVSAAMESLAVEGLDAGEVLIRVAYSSVNYKDALAATGAGKIIRRFPCVGGIDLSGTVVESSDPRFKAAMTPASSPRMPANNRAAIDSSRVAGNSAENSVHTLSRVLNDSPKSPWASLVT